VNKKVNTALFIIGATIVNLVLMAVILLIGFVILSLLPINNASGIGTILVILVFFAAIVGTFVIYHNMVKYLSTKIDMDKYFHPIIKRKEDK
jgi:hypothetical protein